MASCNRMTSIVYVSVFVCYILNNISQFHHDFQRDFFSQHAKVEKLSLPSFGQSESEVAMFKVMWRWYWYHMHFMAIPELSLKESFGLAVAYCFKIFGLDQSRAVCLQQEMNMSTLGQMKLSVQTVLF